MAETIALLKNTYGHKDLCVILAPRHLERAELAERIISRKGFTIRRRSTKDIQTADVLLLDTFGELARAYAVADVAFIGGSLVKQGGQSVFQPLAQGVPAVFGPYMNNQRDIAALAQSEGVGIMVRNADELAATINRLLSLSTDEKEALSQKARNLIERNQGVTARTLDAVEAAMQRRVSERP